MGVITYQVPEGVKRMTIGVQGEANVREFLFDVTEWRQITGDLGTAEMVVQRRGDSSPYAAAITMHDENTVSWVPTAADTAKDGVGKLQLMWIASGQTVKTKIFDMKVDPALDYDLPDDSLDPWASWMPDVINAAAEIGSLEAQVDTRLDSQDAAIAALRAAVGSPLVANTAAAMTDQNKIYVYTGDESGYTAGNWYYYDGTAWASGGVYNAAAVETDTTLSVPGVPADAKAAGDEIDGVKSALNTGYQHFSDEATFVRGVLSSGALVTGSSYNYRAASNHMFHFDRDLRVCTNPGYQFSYAIFTNGTTFLRNSGWVDNEHIIPAGTYFKAQIRKYPEDTSVAADVDTFIQQVYYENGTLKLAIDVAEPALNGNITRFAGKKISIIGDSIETFDEAGYKIDGYRMYYPSIDVTNVNHTWWKKVIDASNAKLEINASWSGSRVTNTASDPSWPDFYDRVSVIGSPDVIFVSLGTNDSTGNVALGDYDYETAYISLSENTFRTAYIKGVKALKATYPNAEIVCITEQMDDKYKESICNIALKLGCVYIDASDYIGSSGVHPAQYGMRQIAALVILATDNTLEQKHMPVSSSAVKNVRDSIELHNAYTENKLYNLVPMFTREALNISTGAKASSTANAIFPVFLDNLVSIKASISGLEARVFFYDSKSYSSASFKGYIKQTLVQDEEFKITNLEKGSYAVLLIKYTDDRNFTADAIQGRIVLTLTGEWGLYSSYMLHNNIDSSGLLSTAYNHRFSMPVFIPLSQYFGVASRIAQYTLYLYDSIGSFVGTIPWRKNYAMNNNSVMNYITEKGWDVSYFAVLFNYTSYTFTESDYGTIIYIADKENDPVISKVLFADGYTYGGEKIVLNSNPVSYEKDRYNVGFPYGQDAAVYGKYLVRVGSNGKARIYNLITNSTSSGMIAECTIADHIPHANSVFFGTTKYDESDYFPILYANAYNNTDYPKGTLFGFRVQLNGTTLTMTHVQTISIGFVDESIWTTGDDDRPYGNFFMDTDRGFLYAYTCLDGHVNKTRFFMFAMPDLTDSSVTLTISDIIDMFDVNIQRYPQGCCYYNGKVYTLNGFSTYGEGQYLPALLNVVDLKTKATTSVVNLTQIGIDEEPEMIVIYENEIVLGYLSAHILNV